MASITIDLPDRQLEKVQKLAQRLGISTEELLRISIEDWLNHPRGEFVQAVEYVLHKNADLYQRLA